MVLLSFPTAVLTLEETFELCLNYDKIKGFDVSLMPLVKHPTGARLQTLATYFL